MQYQKRVRYPLVKSIHFKIKWTHLDLFLVKQASKKTISLSYRKNKTKRYLVNRKIQKLSNLKIKDQATKNPK